MNILKKCVAFCILFVIIYSVNADSIFQVDADTFIVYGQTAPVGDWIKLNNSVYFSYILLSDNNIDWRIGKVYYIIIENYV